MRKLTSKYAFSLLSNPSYTLALQHMMNKNYSLCAEYLEECRPSVQEPSEVVELLALLSEA
jgi:hypothetical protein